jgi:biopolymer transport protein ExbD/biopolymer transport protein TolR
VDKDKYDDTGLEQRLKDEVIANAYRPVLVKGDQAITVGDVRKVMAIARKAGVRGVQLAVDQIKSEGQGGE